MTSSIPADDARCPCGSGETFGACCGPLLARKRRAPTAQALMRSRFTANAVADAEHLHRTWDPATRPSLQALQDSVGPQMRWLHLSISEVIGGGPFDDAGAVEFTAVARSAQGREVLHERSRFRRDGGVWLYVDGELGESDS